MSETQSEKESPQCLQIPKIHEEEELNGVLQTNLCQCVGNI